MAIIEKKNRVKKYSYMFRDYNKKCIYGPYFATREEAKEAEIKAKAEVLTGTYVPPTNLTVLEAIDRYLETKTELSSSSMTANKTYRRWIAKHYLGNLKLREATPLHVADFKAWLMKETLAPTTKRSVLSFLRTCMKWATAYDLVGRDPTRQLKLPKQDAPKGMHVPIEIIIRILRMLRKYEYATIYMPFLLGGFCGLRVSEALAIPHSVVGMPYLVVNRNIQRIKGGGFQFTSPKTPTSVRNVPLIPLVQAEIRNYDAFIRVCQLNAQKRRKALVAACPNFDDANSTPAWDNSLDLLIVHPEDGSPFVRDMIERRWSIFRKQNPEWLQLIEEYPLLEGMRHHDFRHSFGSNMRDRGVGIADISEILGHADSNFTRKTYALPLPETHLHAMQHYAESLGMETL